MPTSQLKNYTTLLIFKSSRHTHIAQILDVYLRQQSYHIPEIKIRKMMLALSGAPLNPIQNLKSIKPITSKSSNLSISSHNLHSPFVPEVYFPTFFFICLNTCVFIYIHVLVSCSLIFWILGFEGLKGLSEMTILLCWYEGELVCVRPLKSCLSESYLTVLGNGMLLFEELKWILSMHWSLLDVWLLKYIGKNLVYPFHFLFFWLWSIWFLSVWLKCWLCFCVVMVFSSKNVYCV